MSLQTVSTKLARIAEQSKRNPTMVFSTLAHLMDEDFLKEAFHQLRKDAAAGVDQIKAKIKRRAKCSRKTLSQEPLAEIIKF